MRANLALLSLKEIAHVHLKHDETCISFFPAMFALHDWHMLSLIADQMTWHGPCCMSLKLASLCTEITVG